MKVNPLDWLEQCRMVKTGDRAVDGHCLPSTIEGEMGEVIDKFRLDTHLVYHRCLQTCEALGIPITEKVLKRGIVKPGEWWEYYISLMNGIRVSLSLC